MPEAIAIANPASIQIALVEDDPRFQAAVASAIRQTDDMQLLWVADTLAQALRALNGGGPAADVLLVDLGLPDGSGIEAIAAAARRWPGCAVMVSTAFGDEAHVLQSIEAGASGYLLKDSMPERIVGEIRSLHAGGSPISPLIARQVLMRFKQAGVQAPEAAVQADAPATLSAREREVLQYITKGFTAEEIARALDVSHHTVLTFVRRTYAKLKVRSKAEAIYEARARGLI
ncbi:response regulator transcription factor [Acidovorax sp. A1169]|uniref:response regulator transcription factor n=1 Tax=Acidovorax sp. A1169 TaxID=3059524 RepID=UPI002737A6BB|nr:response regulator transcription factor [Acidovorax sp. A1169]MDP4076766.1 response regulator transcription factor [Acidovorax sp. A1169]